MSFTFGISNNFLCFYIFGENKLINIHYYLNGPVPTPPPPKKKKKKKKIEYSSSIFSLALLNSGHSDLSLVKH